MKVNSIRFGEIEVPDDRIIQMEKPVLGFEEFRHYCLIDIEEYRPILWLQSIDDPAVVLPVVNPRVFFPDYTISINSNEIAELLIENVNAVETYAVMTITDNAEDISVNLQGPILINTDNNLGKQLVLVNSKYQVKHKIISAIKDKVVEIELEPISV